MNSDKSQLQEPLMKQAFSYQTIQESETPLYDKWSKPVDIKIPAEAIRAQPQRAEVLL